MKLRYETIVASLKPARVSRAMVRVSHFDFCVILARLPLTKLQRVAIRIMFQRFSRAWRDSIQICSFRGMQTVAKCQRGIQRGELKNDSNAVFMDRQFDLACRCLEFHARPRARCRSAAASAARRDDGSSACATVHP